MKTFTIISPMVDYINWELLDIPGMLGFVDELDDYERNRRKRFLTEAITEAFKMEIEGQFCDVIVEEEIGNQEWHVYDENMQEITEMYDYVWEMLDTYLADLVYEHFDYEMF